MVPTAIELSLPIEKNFDKDVEVLAKLCKGLIGPSGCSPNLHSLHHMIRKLFDLKGHPACNMRVECLASKTSPLCSINIHLSDVKLSCF